jgi:hypothetical protein
MRPKYAFRIGIFVGIAICIGIDNLKDKIQEMPDPGSVLFDSNTDDLNQVLGMINDIQLNYHLKGHLDLADVYEAFHMPILDTDYNQGWKGSGFKVWSYWHPKLQRYILVFPPMDYF